MKTCSAIVVDLSNIDVTNIELYKTAVLDVIKQLMKQRVHILY